MQGAAALVRTEPGLTEGLRILEAISRRALNCAAPGGAAANAAWQCALDVRSLVTVAEAVMRSALERRESRGAHVRDDFPSADPQWSRGNVVIRGTAGSMQPVVVPRSEPPEALGALVAEASQA
jgi:succinate dehydrogenase / fumarate reductase, flavoprotein subunit